jgi:hypothetical protein
MFVSECTNKILVNHYTGNMCFVIVLNAYLYHVPGFYNLDKTRHLFDFIFI